jgi:DnaJ-domain-containing protein 1
MQGNFQKDREPDSAQPSRFFTEVQQLFGDDPDPLFLEESWALGIPAAVENLHHRRQHHAERERQNRAFRELGCLGAVTFVEDREKAIESLLADRAASVASRYDANWSQRSSMEETPASAWAPHDWSPEDRAQQSWIPEGWMPAGVPPQVETAQRAELSAAIPDVDLTESRARQILNVTEGSSREEIRSAYRRMVGQWHPDRLQHATDRERHHATQQMATLNEAYRMLCTALLQKAA